MLNKPVPMRARFILSILLLLATGLLAHATAIYKTKYNGYAGLARIADAQLEDGNLLVDNRHDTSLVMLDSMSLVTPSYRYFARMANFHNGEGKQYAVVDAEGKKKHVASTRCGIVFNAANDSNYWAVLSSCGNTRLHDDLLDKRYMSVELVQVVDNIETVVKEARLSKDVNLKDGLNAIGVDVNQGAVTVLVGSDELNQVFTVELPAVLPQSHAGCVVGPGAKVEIERTVLSYKTNDQMQVTTPWSRDELDAHFAQSRNPYEGYWEYLDRDMNDDVLRLGGRYTVALVETDRGYDIIYVNGGQVRKSQWETGMLKGRLEKTIFTDNFKAMWIDATFRPIDQDVQAAFESGVILNVKFPVYKSQVRFSKVLK